ncbi:ABC transporter permease [Jiulongibacter sediminis]|uniref:ABC transporter n=1 Tax=Jiulongibacter sediminis TaxID=1605367 RepID=A0A0P7C4M1_9BACT|nr:ABC transporter permease [Jiulongibacter sediminis]KPM49291.1 ABC transporter [Jiulongibacter sediminis]TBX26343.1 ABC transporter [Jiulongibacter sediminis]
MNLTENIAEGLRAIQGNLLRAIITALIIALGILALVGILTAVDGIQNNVNQSMSGLGANTFDIVVDQRQGRRQGMREKPKPPVVYREAKQFKQIFTEQEEAVVSLYTSVSGAVEVKHGSEKSNPNIQVVGVDPDYIGIKAYQLQNGRNINESDMSLSSNIAVIGFELATRLFPKTSPIDKEIAMLGNRYKVVGVLQKKGSLSGGGDDRVVLIPLSTGREFDTRGRFSYEITTSVTSVENIEEAIGEATAVMRRVRGDEVGEDDSFMVERADALIRETEEVTGAMQMGGLVIAVITLLGASIALMNIMMVSVTERTREIGVRKALGASPSKIRLQFLIEAIVICLLGGAAGVLLGIIGGNTVSSLMFDQSSFIIPWDWIIVGLIVCISVGLLSGFYPAYKASKLDPIESLRYE